MKGLRTVIVAFVLACTAVASPASAATPSWSALPVPAAVPPVTVSDLAARGPGEAWATGYEHAADGLRPMSYWWDGTAWSRDTTFPGSGEPGWLGKVQFVGEETWIFHNRAGAGEILRRSAEGWSAVPLPTTLWTYQDFAAVPGAAWVVGEDETGLKVLHYDGSPPGAPRIPHWATPIPRAWCAARTARCGCPYAATARSSRSTGGWTASAPPSPTDRNARTPST